MEQPTSTERPATHDGAGPGSGAAFRAARAGDTRTLVDLWEHAHWSQAIVQGPRWIKGRVADRAVRSEHFEVWIIEHEGQTVGVYCLVIDHEPWKRDATLPAPARAVRKLWRSFFRAGPAAKADVSATRDDEHAARTPIPPHAKGSFLIQQLVTLRPAARGLGIGRQILAHSEERARHHQRASIRSDVHPNNTTMRRLLERNGYFIYAETADGYLRYCKVVEDS